MFFPTSFIPVKPYRGQSVQYYSSTGLPYYSTTVDCSTTVDYNTTVLQDYSTTVNYYSTVGSGRNTWRFCKTVVSGSVGVGNLSLSALLAGLRAFQLAWSAGLQSIGLLLWRRIPKTTILSWLREYFVGTSTFIGTSVTSRNTSSSENISRARCTKRNQGQRWIWNRTSGKKWLQFLPTCCNEWCRTSSNAWGNVLTRDTTSQTLYSGSECCN